MEADIRESINLLLDSIKRSDGPRISAEMERLDSLAAGARGALHPQLVHFLERRSYAKALHFLNERSGNGRLAGGGAP